MEYEIINETPVTIAEAKEIMKKVSAKEQTFEQKQARENTAKMAKLSMKKALELKKELSGIEMRKLKEDNIINLIDILPATMDEIKIVLSSSKTPFNKEEMESILEIVKKYAKSD